MKARQLEPESFDTNRNLGQYYIQAGKIAEAQPFLEHAQQIKPDVIPLDLSMPGMNGLQAASELRRVLPNTPIILFTLYGETLSKSEISKTGISLVLSKTEPLSMLIEKAHELMGS